MTDQTNEQAIKVLQERTANIAGRIDEVDDVLDRHEREFSKIRIIADPGPTQDKLWKALAAAQGEIKDAAKDSEADAGKYKYKYATLANVLAVIRPVATKHKLAVTQLPSRSIVDGSELLGLTTIIAHESGQTIENYFEMYPPQRDPQGIGSAMTYMRRYVLMAMFAIAGADDDDAERAQPELKKISAAQADQIFNLADELFGADSEAMLQRMCEKIHMVEAVRDIPAEEFEVAMRRIENQAKKRGTKPPEEVAPPKEKAPKKAASKPADDDIPVA
jgi:hypothetical protein